MSFEYSFRPLMPFTSMPARRPWQKCRPVIDHNIKELGQNAPFGSAAFRTAERDMYRKQCRKSKPVASKKSRGLITCCFENPSVKIGKCLYFQAKIKAAGFESYFQQTSANIKTVLKSLTKQRTWPHITFTTTPDLLWNTTKMDLFIRSYTKPQTVLAIRLPAVHPKHCAHGS